MSNEPGVIKTHAIDDMFNDVGEFHRKFGLYTADEQAPWFLSDDLHAFRLKFLQEELTEFQEAVESLDYPKAADALVDLVYVALGTAHLMGVPFHECWEAVQAANMKKERATGADDSRSKRGHAADVVKPEGWTPPDIASIIRARLKTMMACKMASTGADEPRVPARVNPPPFRNR